MKKALLFVVHNGGSFYVYHEVNNSFAEWTVQYGHGRVFVSTYGHVRADQKDPKGMKCSAFQTIMVRVLKWLAHWPAREVPPADFPTADAVSLREP